MKKVVSDIRMIQRHTPALGGVFTLPDLASLMAEPHQKELYRRIGRLAQGNILKRFSRGVYLADPHSVRALAQKVREDSYISFGNVLADARAIGSVPAFQVDAVALGRSRSFREAGLTLRYFGISKGLFFGFETRDGIKTALPEKALLDTLYFHQHGARFFFDLFSDINVAAFDRPTLDRFLVNYKNPKFQAFVKDYLRERGLAKRR